MTNEAAFDRKETYSGSMVLFTGVYYLVLLVKTLLHVRGALNVVYGATALYWLFMGVLHLWGSILFFRVRPGGWIIAAGALLNLVVLIGLFSMGFLKNGYLSGYTAIVIAFTLVVWLCFVFLFRKPTRLKFEVSNQSYLLALALFVLLRAVAYLL